MSARPSHERVEVRLVPQLGRRVRVNWRSMRQFAIAILLLAVLAAPAHAATNGVRVTSCQSALDPAERVAAFEGRMRVKHHARRMQMRFTLQMRSADEPSWRRLPAAGFGKWLTSDQGIGRYVYTKRVIELEA